MAHDVNASVGPAQLYLDPFTGVCAASGVSAAAADGVLRAEQPEPTVLVRWGCRSRSFSLPYHEGPKAMDCLACPARLRA